MIVLNNLDTTELKNKLEVIYVSIEALKINLWLLCLHL